MSPSSVVRRRHRRIEHWDDERGMGNGIIVTLLPGFSFEPNGHEGVRGFDTVAEAMRAVRDSSTCAPDCVECAEIRRSAGGAR